MRGMHADTEKEVNRAKAIEKRRCERLGSGSSAGDMFIKVAVAMMTSMT